MTDGLQLLVQLITAAMTTEPWTSWYSWPQCRKGILMSCFSFEMWKPLKPTCMENKWLVRLTLGYQQTKRCKQYVTGISMNYVSPNIWVVLLTLKTGRVFIVLLPSHPDNSGSLLSCCWLPLCPEASSARSHRAPWNLGWSQSPAQRRIVLISL